MTHEKESADIERCQVCGANDDLRRSFGLMTCYTCGNPDKRTALQLLGVIRECFNDDEQEWNIFPVIEGYINANGLLKDTATGEPVSDERYAALTRLDQCWHGYPVLKEVVRRALSQTQHSHVEDDLKIQVLKQMADEGFDITPIHMIALNRFTKAQHGTNLPQAVEVEKPDAGKAVSLFNKGCTFASEVTGNDIFSTQDKAVIVAALTEREKLRECVDKLAAALEVREWADVPYVLEKHAPVIRACREGEV